MGSLFHWDQRNQINQSMCGIAGIVKFKGPVTLDDFHAVKRMMDAQVHRGPDDSGLYQDEHIVLGHRRLSIIDLSNLGHQPMMNEACPEYGRGNEDICITFNGEIYNFLEIRKELELLGYKFRSNSDTEVILKAYQEWGEESFKRFIGMFSFCILDKRSNCLYLVRDHAGIKPLYYYLSEEGLLFASEVRALRALDKNWEEDSTWKIYFLIFGHIPEPFTTLKNIFMLPKGSFLRLNLRSGKHELKKYAEMTFSEEIKNIKEAFELVRSEFTHAIKRHLISDAPLGVFLSGGIDSSVVALVAHHFEKDNLRTLSVVFREEGFSEEKYQDIVLNKINSIHYSYLITEKDFIKNLEDIFQAMDQPTIDGINTYFISRCAKKEGLKSVLSGLGGDELFGGYPSFKRIDMFWHLRKLNGSFKEFFKLFQYTKNDKLKKLSFLSLPNHLSYYLLFRGLFSIRDTAQILNITEREVSEAIEKLYFEVDSSLGKRNFISYLETNLYMQNQLLRDTDFMGMWHSVEVRVPFLDRKFMNLVFSISEKIKFNGGTPKYLLVKAFEDILPNEIGFRKKQGFTFPFAQWIKRQGRELFEEAVLKGNINNKYSKGLWERFEYNNLHWSRIWAPIILGLKKI